MSQQLPTYEDLLQQLCNAQQEVLMLKEENSALRKVLEENGIKYVEQRAVAKAKQKERNNLSVEQRVELFRSLFKGRYF